MAETFQVGDTVRTPMSGVPTATIAFGPFRALQNGPERFMVQAPDGTAHSVVATDLRPYVAFAVGETVEERAMGTAVEIEAGPFAGISGHDFYVIKRRNGVHSWVKSSMLRKREPASASRLVNEALKAAGYSSTFEYVPASPRAFTHQGRTYRLDAEYADRQGDVWKFNGRKSPTGLPLMDCALYPTFRDVTIADVVTSYGPLSRA